jgi:hypothetical protein
MQVNTAYNLRYFLSLAWEDFAKIVFLIFIAGLI